MPKKSRRVSVNRARLGKLLDGVGRTCGYEIFVEEPKVETLQPHTMLWRAAHRVWLDMQAED